MADMGTDPPRGNAGSPGPSTSGPASPGVRQADQHAPRTRTRLSTLHVGLVTGAVLLVLLVVFLIQNAHTVQISFLGAHLRVSLAVAMLIAAVAGALITGTAGTARIGQLRRRLRGERRADHQ